MPSHIDKRRPLMGKRVFDDQGRSICGARTRGGAPCRQRPMANGRCRLHGGKHPVGPAHPNYVDGRYSRFLPRGLRTAYESTLSDPKLIELRDEIALLDVVIADRIDRAQLGAPGHLVGELSALVATYKQHAAKRNATGMIATVDAIGAAVHEQRRVFDFIDDIAPLIDLRRKLVTAEANRLFKMHDVITAEQAMVLLDQVVGVVTENVTDRTQLAGITSSLRALIESDPDYYNTDPDPRLMRRRHQC